MLLAINRKKEIIFPNNNNNMVCVVPISKENIYKYNMPSMY